MSEPLKFKATASVVTQAGAALHEEPPTFTQGQVLALVFIESGMK